MRQIVLDTETTGLEVSQGHRIIEIGCVELVNRKLTGNHYHQYINPHREIDQGAIEVHGITNDFLADKPAFEAIASTFLEFVQGACVTPLPNGPFLVFTQSPCGPQPALYRSTPGIYTGPLWNTTPPLRPIPFITKPLWTLTLGPFPGIHTRQR